MTDKQERPEKEDLDALCPECGHAFATYVNRIVPGDRENEMDEKVKCPVCGCGECDIVKPGT